MKKRMLISTLAIAILSTTLLTACAGQTAAGSTTPSTPSSQPNLSHVISVTGSEVVTVIPDIAELVYGVTTQASDAVQCMELNTKDVNKTIEVLKGFGLEDKDIQTSEYSLTPRYDWSNDTQKLVGYEMQTTITASNISLDKVGDILSGSVSAGINTIESISYESSQYDERYAEAMAQAITSAKVKAEAMAQAAGCSVGKVSNIQEDFSESPIRNTTNLRADMAVGASEEKMEIMPGQVEINASVTVEFEIQ
ncbi:MAG: SIMPL domain-containing protein [Lachnospiraceae bacterium]